VVRLGSDQLVAEEANGSLLRGRYTPDSTLKMDVLPAPFGPMMANSSRSATVNETPSSAVTPAKRRLTSLKARMSFMAS
jgi:hypothetical protein